MNECNFGLDCLLKQKLLNRFRTLDFEKAN